MDVRTFPELGGGGDSKKNPCSEMGPKLNLNLYFKKNLAHYWHN